MNFFYKLLERISRLLIKLIPTYYKNNHKFQNKNQITNDYKNIQRLLTTGEDAGKETINMERIRTQAKDIKANHEKGKFVPHSFDPYNQTVGEKTELDSMYAKDNIM